jgi:hypothetical protein
LIFDQLLSKRIAEDMEERHTEEELLVRYLLGQLPEEEQDRVEDRYAVDEDFFEELLIIETELIDQYVKDELPGRARQQFETYFLSSPSRFERLDTARTMMRWLATAPVSTTQPSTHREARSWFQNLSPFWKNRTLQLATGIAIVAVVFASSWAIIRNFQHSREAPQRLSFELISNAVRSTNELRTLEIRPGVSLIEFHLYLDRSVQGRFNATFQTAPGKIVQTAPGLEAQPTTSGKAVIVSLPSNLFSTGDYFVTLADENDKGTSDIASEYQFRVVKQ